MSFTWIPYYKELAEKLIQYRNNRKDLLTIICGLDDEYVSFLQKDKNKNKILDIHPFAIFNRWSDEMVAKIDIKYFIDGHDAVNKALEF